MQGRFLLQYLPCLHFRLIGFKSTQTNTTLNLHYDFSGPAFGTHKNTQSKVPTIKFPNPYTYVWFWLDFWGTSATPILQPSYVFSFPQNWLDVVCCSGFPVLNDVHCNAALRNEDCSWLIFLRASTWAQSKKVLWIWQNLPNIKIFLNISISLMAHLLARLNLGRIQKKSLEFGKIRNILHNIYKDGSTSCYQITLYAFQFMICPILWNEVQLPNIKIFLKRKWYCPNFGQTFLFFRKAFKPMSSEATHLFCRQTRIYCLSRKTIADKYIFLTEIYIFILLSACFLFF